MKTKTKMIALALLAAASLLGCTTSAPPQPQSQLRITNATIRIDFKDPGPKTLTIPVTKNRGVATKGEFYSGTTMSGGTNDHNVVIVRWELVGNSSSGRGDVYYFEVGEGMTLDNRAQHLVLYTGSIQEVVDTDRVAITIGPKTDVEQPGA